MANLKNVKKGIALAKAYNSTMRGGAKAGLSGQASRFLKENPNATSKKAPRLTDKYR